MHPKFQVGETARLVASEMHPQLIGRLVEIRQPLRERVIGTGKDKVVQACYVATVEGAQGAFGIQEWALAKVFEPCDWETVEAFTGWKPDRRVRIPYIRPSK